jgi:hypothetical protein
MPRSTKAAANISSNRAMVTLRCGALNFNAPSTSGLYQGVDDNTAPGIAQCEAVHDYHTGPATHGFSLCRFRGVEH